jgi:hypothetical protein
MHLAVSVALRSAIKLASNELLRRPQLHSICLAQRCHSILPIFW